MLVAASGAEARPKTQQGERLRSCVISESGYGAAMRFIFPIAALLVLAGCSSRPEPAAPPPSPRPVATRPAPAPAPAPVKPWEDRARAPGNWVYRADARGALAMYGVPGTDASFLVRCDRERARIFLSRQGQPEANAGMTIRTTTGLRTWPAFSTGSTPAYAGIELGPRDPHLDAMAFSRGKFLVQVTGMADLVVPTWTEFGRVVEDCRG